MEETLTHRSSSFTQDAGDTRSYVTMPDRDTQAVPGKQVIKECKLHMWVSDAVFWTGIHPVAGTAGIIIKQPLANNKRITS